MEGTMKVAVMKGIRKMEFEQWPIPQIKDDEVLVKINHVGVCGSDLHFFEAGRIGNWIVDSDLVLGHESGGTVVEVGSKVSKGDVISSVGTSAIAECASGPHLHFEILKDGEYMEPEFE